jgi:hypothetical protein
LALTKSVAPDNDRFMFKSDQTAGINGLGSWFLCQPEVMLLLLYFCESILPFSLWNISLIVIQGVEKPETFRNQPIAWILMNIYTTHGRIKKNRSEFYAWRSFFKL